MNNCTHPQSLIDKDGWFDAKFAKLKVVVLSDILWLIDQAGDIQRQLTTVSPGVAQTEPIGEFIIEVSVDSIGEIESVSTLKLKDR